MLVSDVLAVCSSDLNDPTSLYWTQAELISYVNQFCQFAPGLKPDLTALRASVSLVSGSYQALPADGMQFLDSYFAGNGQAVFIRKLEEVKHAKFANATGGTQVANVQVACADPRDPKRFFVFPPSTGSGSTLEILYTQIPTVVTTAGATYPLPSETVDSCFWYVLALAFRKPTDRQDLDRAGICYQNSIQWFGLRTQAQFGQDPQEDNG